MENTYTLSDIATASGNGNAFGGSSWTLIILILFIMIFGGANGRGYGDYGQFATAASQQEILFGQQFSNLDNKIDRIGNGIADATFSLNNNLFGVQTAITSAIGNVGTAVNTEGRNVQMQLANYTCENQKNVDALRYDMATMFANSNANTTAQIQGVKDMIAADKIESLQNQVNALQLQSAMCGVVRYPQASTYCAGTSPFCGCNNGCGCRNV